VKKEGGGGKRSGGGRSPVAPAGRPGNERPGSESASVRFHVKVTPRASKNEIIGWDEQGTLRIRIKAAPIEGQANAELTGWLAKLVGVPKSAVRVLHGASGRLKRIEITGITEAALKGALH
jgi:uncharacterized protein (TIGR00251 family)